MRANKADRKGKKKQRRRFCSLCKCSTGSLYRVVRFIADAPLKNSFCIDCFEAFGESFSWPCCHICGTTQTRSRHHIHPQRKYRGGGPIENLCFGCHKRFERRLKGKERTLNRILSKKENEKFFFDFVLEQHALIHEARNSSLTPMIALTFLQPVNKKVSRIRCFNERLQLDCR